MHTASTSTSTSGGNSEFNANRFREDFPILHQEVHGRPLVYLDNAATSQKPRVVVQSIVDYYEHYNSNVHRGAHALAERATIAFEDAREIARAFVGAPSTRCVNFTKGTTDGINLVASGLSQSYLKAGDVILVSGMEHHSNIVPWQLAAERCGAKMVAVPVTDSGELDREFYREQLATGKVKMISLVWISNSLGTVNPAKELIAEAHDAGAKVLLDGAQAAPHMNIDVQDLDCDFLAFSGHKVYAPTGTGILYGKEAELEALPPYQGGGEMIRTVSFEGTTFNDLPFKFEAGTPNICGAIALGTGLQYLMDAGREAVAAHERDLIAYTLEKLSGLEGIRLIGEAPQRAGAVSFVVGEVHPYDVGVLLDKQGVAVRTGHHCCQPLMDRFGIEGTVRASFALYNTREDVQHFASALERSIRMLTR